MRSRAASTYAGRASTSRNGRLAAGLGAVVVLCAGCAGTGTADPAPPPVVASPRATTPSSPAASRPADSRPGAPRRETTSRATPRQLTGLVRIVAQIGTDGRRELLTGMVLSGTGETVTNAHGVAGATAVRATVMSTGETYDARVLGADPSRDVALLRLVGATGLATVTLAVRDAVVGDPVTVVGDARGLESTFTAATGRVLALGQTLQTADTPTARAERITGVMLSSSDVVTGVSGGPTYDVRGEVAGMTTASVRDVHGLSGVAIPSAALRTTVRRLRHRTG